MPTKDQRLWLVAVVLAIGLCTALNTLTLGVLIEAIFDPEHAGLSENATQILTGWGGGIVGVLGAYVGYRVGQGSGPDTARSPAEPVTPERETVNE